jgi:DNA-binding protein HU-beta
MNKAELIEAITKETGLFKKDCDTFLSSFTTQVTNALKAGNDVKLLGFGTFNRKDRHARKGRNPKTGDTIQIAACKVARFKAGAELKKAVNQTYHGSS